MAEPDRRTDQQKLLDDICPIHQTPMVKTQEHIGDGKVGWSAPSCSLCEDLKRDGKYDAVKEAVDADRAKLAAAGKAANAGPATPPKEQAAAVAVKSDAAPAAKT